MPRNSDVFIPDNYLHINPELIQNAPSMRMRRSYFISVKKIDGEKKLVKLTRPFWANPTGKFFVLVDHISEASRFASQSMVIAARARIDDETDDALRTLIETCDENVVETPDPWF